MTIDEVLSYSPMMQFELIDDEERSFVVNRYCYFGSVDDWITISSPGPLDELVPQFVCHLGEDSYYDLH